MLKCCVLVFLFGFTAQWVWAEEDGRDMKKEMTPLERYVAQPDEAYEYKLVHTIDGKGYTGYVIRMVSQKWLTASEVDRPIWWHWLTVVVPDQVQSHIGLLTIAGGSHQSDQPDKVDNISLQLAMTSQSVVARLHNIPNQPLVFVGDDYGPRKEDELIAYGWRLFLEGGAQDDDAEWLARLPMTKAAVRAMDTITDFCAEKLNKQVERFVVAGGSKRGWTTWTTAVVDQRVVAIAPFVIDMLNVVPSFEHHWRAYGFWAPAVDDYTHERIFDWQRSAEYRRLREIVEPYSYRDRLTLPKFIVNAAGDQFFLPDSWQFYWDDLKGEKYLRYVANTDHGLDDSNAIHSFAAFYHAIVTDTPRPRFDWRLDGSTLLVHTDPDSAPEKIRLWKATNPETRDFRLMTIDKAWIQENIALSEDGTYQVSVEAPEKGWTAFFVEAEFPSKSKAPFVFSTGVVVVPDAYPFPPFEIQNPQGTQN